MVMNELFVKVIIVAVAVTLAVIFVIYCYKKQVKPDFSEILNVICGVCIVFFTVLTHIMPDFQYSLDSAAATMAMMGIVSVIGGKIKEKNIECTEKKLADTEEHIKKMQAEIRELQAKLEERNGDKVEEKPENDSAGE